MTPRGYTDAREKVMRAASDLFYKQGYQATTIDQVIEQSGVSRPTVYAHFSTKEAMCLAYLSRRREEDLERLREAIKKETSPREQFLAVIKFVRNVMIQSKYRGCGYFNMISEFPDGKHPIFKEARNYIDDLREVIGDAVKAFKAGSPRHKDLDVRRTADIYYLIVCGAIMGSQEYRETWPLDRALSAIEDLIR